jgi:hypothetical protein
MRVVRVILAIIGLMLTAHYFASHVRDAGGTTAGAAATARVRV